MALEVDDYPYIKNDMTPDEVMVIFNNIRAYVPEFRNIGYNIYNMPNLDRIELLYLPDKAPCLLANHFSDYAKYNRISSYFTEPCRVRAKRYDNALSPYEYWVKNKAQVKQHAIANFGNDNNHSLNETLFKEIMGASAFRSTNLAAILYKFKSTRILDFSSGWGDRLISAMACNVEYYCGVDPNTCLHPEYQSIVKFFSQASKTKVDMICSPFETAKVDQTFDMIFTSPPYFNLEVYSAEKTQSSQYGDLNNWYAKFLLVSLKKAWSMLVENGYMVIVINDIRNGDKFTQQMVQDINLFVDSVYLGVISYGEVKDDKIRSPQPMWIWRKVSIETDPIIVIKDCTFQNKTFHVVRDDYLLGGTKQRAYKMFSSIKEHEVVYAGPYTGFAQVAIAIGAKLHGKKATIFLSDIHTTTIRARMYGTNIKEFKNSNLHMLQASAKNYADKNKCYYMPFGFDIDIFKDALFAQLVDKIPTNIKPSQTIWVVAGSATLLQVLLKLFPKNKFGVVQVGKRIWPDQMNNRCVLYIADEKFYDPAITMPPYSSVISYDAKLWQFASKFGKSDDIIWNVASDMDLLPKVGGDETHQPSAEFTDKLNTEYQRYKTTNEILKFMYKSCCDKKEKYEIKNIFERWLISSANLIADSANVAETDKVYSQHLVDNINHEINKHFVDEIIDKKIMLKYYANALLKTVLEKIQVFLTLSVPVVEQQQIIISIESSIVNFKYRDFQKNIAKNRYDIFRSKASVEQILIMMLRYASIISSSQHWSMPLKNYKRYVKDYNVEIEGFASPLNSQLILIDSNLKFCSLFKDTDQVFGSLGSFFNNNFNNTNVSVGPPYITELLNKVAEQCLAQCQLAETYGNKVRFLITFSSWKDIAAYKMLMNSKYLVYHTQLEATKHFYINPNEFSKNSEHSKIKSHFDTCVFVLEYGMNSHSGDYLNMLDDMKIK